MRCSATSSAKLIFDLGLVIRIDIIVADFLVSSDALEHPGWDHVAQRTGSSAGQRSPRYSSALLFAQEHQS